MIRCVRVRNFGVIEEVEVELGTGLTVVTGETGAGKSMLLDALMLLAGGRADSQSLRSGCDEASVEGVFEATPVLKQRLEDRGLEIGSDEVLIRRTVSAQGRGRVWVNGNLVTVTVLQQLVHGLIDLAGQLEHATLFDESNHRVLLDRFGGLEAESSVKKAYLREWDHHQSLLARLAALGGDEREVRVRTEFLQYQVNELEAAAAELGEEGRLEAERRRLGSSARIEHLVRAVEQSLSAQDGSASDRLHEAGQRLAEAEKLDSSLRPIRERVGAAAAELEDGVRSLTRYLGHLESNPARLSEVEERLEVLRSLSRKHAVSPDQLSARLEELKLELDQLQRRSVVRSQIEGELTLSKERLSVGAAALTSARVAAAGSLERMVSETLGRLALKHAEFSVELVSQPVAASGADQVRFLFCANPGESARPLSKVVSGGEASRVMLAVKAALAQTERVAVSVLDEVDTGVGGAVADVVGRLIKDLSGSRQVLCITHLPQVAAHANRHLRISKKRVGNRVQSSVESLSSLEARSDELARMLSGVEVSKEAHAAAQALIASAAKPEALGSARRKRDVRTGVERRTA